MPTNCRGGTAESSRAPPPPAPATAAIESERRPPSTVELSRAPRRAQHPDQVNDDNYVKHDRRKHRPLVVVLAVDQVPKLEGYERSRGNDREPLGPGLVEKE